MRYPATFTRTLTRNIRRRTYGSQRPADFLNDATTFSDTYADDPFSVPRYPNKQLFDFLKKEAETQDSKLAKKAGILKSEKLKTALNFDHIPIEKQIVILFPGQGEQFVGMGEKLKYIPACMEVYEKASSILNYDIWDLCQNGPKSKLNQTIYCQTAVFVNTMAAIEKMRTEITDLDERLTDVAGFGVGEFTALVMAGVLKFEDALKLVNTQARLINECNQLASCSSFLVSVNAASKLETAIKEVRRTVVEQGEMPLCEVAAYLYCGTKVLGASHLCKKILAENSERFNFKIGKTFPVIGAPYTGLMRPSEQSMVQALKDVELGTAHINVYSNYLGKIYPRRKAMIRQCIFRQFSNPIKWEQIICLIRGKVKDGATCSSFIKGEPIIGWKKPLYPIMFDY